MSGLCTECLEKQRNVLLGSEYLYERYIQQNEECHACKRYCFYDEMFIVFPSLFCNRCYKAAHTCHWSISHIRNSIRYVNTHGPNTVRVLKKRSFPYMLLNRILRANGFDRCHDCTTLIKSRSYCKPCATKHRKDLAPYRKRRFEILARAGYKCRICRRQYKSPKLALDHDHRTGKFRDVLCMNCNRAIGLMWDDPVHMRKLIRGLQTTAVHPVPMQPLPPLTKSIVQRFIEPLPDEVRQIILKHQAVRDIKE